MTRHPFGEALKTLEDASRWSRSELLDHRDRAFRQLMTHCWDFVPYYRRLMDERGLTPGDFHSASDLAKLPYLTKSLIRSHHQDLQATNIPDSSCIVRRSGGTTGEPIAVRVDPRCRAFETNCYLRGLEWSGWAVGRPMISLFGGSLGLPKKRTMRTRTRLWLLNQVFLPAAELGADNVRQYVAQIRAHPGGILVGYSSAIMALAQYMAQEGIEGGLPLEAAVCTADQLHASWRTSIGRTFGVPVFSYYGCGEIHSLGFEKSAGGNYLVPQEHVVLEVAGDSPGEFREEGSGPFACTALFNYAMPLLRYIVGDQGTLAAPSSEAAYQVVTQLEGREFDYLEAVDGDRITGAFASHLVLVSQAPVWKWQVVQFGRATVDFRCLTEDGKPLPREFQDKIASAMKRHLGSGMQVTFTEGGFETSSSLKHRIIVRKDTT